MTNAHEVRERVSTAYAGAVSRPSPSSSSSSTSPCCETPGAAGASASPCCEAPIRGRDGKGVAFTYAGYEREALADVPEDAVEHAFGCGNPLAFSEVAPGETVLDLGSGAGIDLILAARKVGDAGKVIGVDMTDAMIDHARRNVEEAGLSHIIELRKGIIEDLPVEDASVDWVISNCVINLSPEKDRVFAEIARVLKPGGRMLISDIVADELPEAVMNDPGLYSSCIGGAISENDYLDGMLAAGLTEVEVRTRHTYDETAIRAIMDSEGCGCGQNAEMSPDEAVRLLAGRIHSIHVAARKGNH